MHSSWCAKLHHIASNLRCTFILLFSELKIGVQLKFKALFFILQETQKHHFPQKTSGLAKRVVYFMDSKMCLLIKICSCKSLF